ncbi:ABATE domain-containing protein [Stenotrophomonas sp. PS02300]|uniref:CGNR zinc finger domain-containing protein n=1 Tax=Stenotrophomonas sp. PS02300 TaxID=2991426 RepID=UPI00249AA120|nr:ABATE domain-containing protein [Stenotrophomonas sp. PS02300]
MKPVNGFEFIAGCIALDFVDTLGERAGRGRERLEDENALAAWLGQAELAPAGVGFSANDLAIARYVREAIYRCTTSIIDGRAPPGDDVTFLNLTASRMPLRPCLQNGVLVRVGDQPLNAAMSVLSEDALGLLVVPRRDRLRRCPECAMVFEDTSRPRKRRWCSSASGCGNRAKVRAHRARRDTET